jgi:hypothetical protein
LKQFLKDIKDRIPPKFVKFIQKFVVFIIAGIILYQLWNIGWIDVIENLPVTPWFYILLAVLYVTLPIAEVYIYRLIWTTPRKELFKTFLIKKVLNEEVFGYSGEVFLYSKAKKFSNKSSRQILQNIRDYSIISAINSNIVAILLISVLIFWGIIPLNNLLEHVSLIYVGLFILIGAILTLLVIQFRKHLFSLPLNTTLKAFGIYFIRFGLHNVILVFQWYLVMPETNLSVWFILVSVVIVLNRIPFLPGKDLVFLWAGIELSRVLDVATAGVAGMLIVSSALTRLANLVIYTWFSSSEDLKDDEIKID